MKVVQLDPDDFIRIKRQRTNVEIFLVPFSANEFKEAVDHFIGGVGQFHAKQSRGLQKTPEMILRTEHKQLFLILVPVGPKTAEHRGSVVESVRQYSNFYV